MGQSNLAVGAEWVGGDGQCPGELGCDNVIFRLENSFILGRIKL